MDPITQGVLGAAAAQLGSAKTSRRAATVIGAAGGMAADLDVFITSSKDPLLLLEYHRHFTHSLAFIPVGGLLVGFFCWLIARGRVTWRESAKFALIGYATHGLLDSCTSWGTQLWWPFSDTRVAWDLISIIDPLYTLPLLAGIIGYGVVGKKEFVVCALIWSFIYLSIGAWQNYRGLSAQAELARNRGHINVTQATVRPTLLNLLLFRSVYLFDGYYYVDALWLGPSVKILNGERVKSYPVREEEAAPSAPQSQRDIGRFRHFTSDTLGVLTESPLRLADVRYGLMPDLIAPLWYIEITAPEDHVKYLSSRTARSAQLRRFAAMILGDFANASLK